MPGDITKGYCPRDITKKILSGDIVQRTLSYNLRGPCRMLDVHLLNHSLKISSLDNPSDTTQPLWINWSHAFWAALYNLWSRDYDYDCVATLMSGVGKLGISSSVSNNLLSTLNIPPSDNRRRLQEVESPLLKFSNLVILFVILIFKCRAFPPPFLFRFPVFKFVSYHM